MCLYWNGGISAHTGPRLHSAVIPPLPHLSYKVYIKRKRKARRRGASVMHHRYKQPDVCQPFKTTRDCDKRRLSCRSLRRVVLKLHKQHQWWDHNRRVGASSSGVSTMLSSIADATHTMVLFENEHSSVWFSRRTKVHAHCCTYGGCTPIKKTHTHTI